MVMILWAVFGSNSVLFAPASPATLRANSIEAHCMPRQMPKNGTFFSRAKVTARILPSIPRTAEAARDEDSVLFSQGLLDLALFQVLGLDPVDLDLESMGESAVVQGLVQAHVGIVEAGILPDQGDVDLVAWDS